MPARLYNLLQEIHPLRLFLLVLGATFLAEVAVMVVLHFVVPPQSTLQTVAVIDACLLTLLLAPLLWWLVVTPLRKVANARQRLLGFALSAQEGERRRIARDLHDGLGQSVTCLLVGLRTIEELSADEPVKEQARGLRRIGGEIHDEIRRLARGLRPAVLDDAGLVPALERFLDDVQATHKIKATLTILGEPPTRLPETIETNLYRIAQEAITNVIRHSASSQVLLTLSYAPQSLELLVEDDGCGFDPQRTLAANEKEQPFGLLSIRERAEITGGTAYISSKPGAGTSLVIRMPIPNGESHDG